MSTHRIEASVIVAVNPHINDVGVVFDAYLRQTIPAAAFEVIVVHDGARNDVAAAFAEHRSAHPATPVRLLETRRPGRAAANNAGVRAARSNLLVFVGDDFIPSPTLVRAHVEFHRNARAAAVGIGPSFFTEELREDPLRRWLEDSGELYGIPFRLAEQSWSRDFFYAGNVSLGRTLFERVGAFDEAFLYDLYDDYEFGVRLRAMGVATHYLPKAVAWHDHVVDLAERTQAMRRSGTAARQCERTHPTLRPWAALAERSIAGIAADVRRAEARHLDEPGSATLGEWFLALMKLAFAEGYHGAGDAPPAARRSGVAMDAAPSSG
jgi:cellulose synthase/poly-beta-1,6-N-acetylglucosamine synthase-like glycosyltransferase